ncbi:WASH complex subunit 2-like isoform X5 [Polyodon spathula]|uniref:WASH complex subunit 2-like isoform X5 n=1 Tax=Polyodon spathula TaxID=7913 RepID=UPI001B7E4433|nr:WASH complex subunit 2-like isoform X5 [Polyodon spathula]
MLFYSSPADWVPAKDKMSAIKNILRNIRNEFESDSRDEIDYEAAPTQKFPQISHHETDISSITKTSFLEDEDSNLYDNPLHSTALGDEHSAQKKHEAVSHNKPKKDKAVSKKNKGVTSKTLRPVAKTQKPTSRSLKRLSEKPEREDSSDLESEASIKEPDPVDNTLPSEAQTDATEKSDLEQSRAKAGKKYAAVSKPRRPSPSVEESSDQEESELGSQSPDLLSQSQRVARKKSGQVQSRAKAGKKSAAVSKPKSPGKQTRRMSPGVEESSDEEASDLTSPSQAQTDATEKSELQQSRAKTGKKYAAVSKPRRPSPSVEESSDQEESELGSQSPDLLSQSQRVARKKSGQVQSRAKAGKKSAAVSKPKAPGKQTRRMSPGVEESSDEEASDLGSQSPDLLSQSQRVARKKSGQVQSRAKAGKKSAAVSKPKSPGKQTRRMSPGAEESSDEEASDLTSPSQAQTDATEKSELQQSRAKTGKKYAAVSKPRRPSPSVEESSDQEESELGSQSPDLLSQSQRVARKKSGQVQSRAKAGKKSAAVSKPKSPGKQTRRMSPGAEESSDEEASDLTSPSQAQTDATEKSELEQSRAKAGKKYAAVNKPRRPSPSVEESSDQEESELGSQSPDLLSQSQRVARKKSGQVQSRAKAGKKSAAVSKPKAPGKRTRRMSPGVEESSDEEASDLECSNPKSSSKSIGKKKNKPSSTSSDEAGPSKKVKKSPKNITELDVVLDAFQGFVSEYKETVESSVCRKAIERLYNKVSDHLIETISEVKECTELKKKSTKIVNSINKKRRSLIEVKSNLIKRETHQRKVQKAYEELEERYADLKSGKVFLDDFKDLQSQYLEHRNNNPGERETYGLSSLPSLLLEARGVLGAEEQLQNINFKLQQAIGN